MNVSEHMANHLKILMYSSVFLTLSLFSTCLDSKEIIIHPQLNSQGGIFLSEKTEELDTFQNAFLQNNKAFSIPGQYEGATTVLIHLDDNDDNRDLLNLIYVNELNNPDFTLITMLSSGAETMADIMRKYPDRKKLVLIPSQIELEKKVWVRDYSPIYLRSNDYSIYKLAAALPGSYTFLDRLGKSPELMTEVKDTSHYLKAQTILTDIFKKALPNLENMEVHHDFFLEGGNILSDGYGTCFTTEYAVFDNKSYPESFVKFDVNTKYEASDLDHVRQKFKDIFGCERVIFLKPNLYEIPHVDMILTVVGRKEVVLSMAYPAAYEFGPVDKAQERTITDEENYNITKLLEAGYTVYRVRRLGVRTYANVLITGSSVYVPQYAKPGVSSLLDQKAVEMFTKLFPDKKVVPFKETRIKLSGSIHCRTVEISRIPLHDVRSMGSLP